MSRYQGWTSPNVVKAYTIATTKGTTTATAATCSAQRASHGGRRLGQRSNKRNTNSSPNVISNRRSSSTPQDAVQPGSSSTLSTRHRISSGRSRRHSGGRRVPGGAVERSGALMAAR